MKIIRTNEQLQIELRNKGEKKVGYVPTMGYLHEGHLSLAHAARKENDLVVMSIFVNPLQFGPNEDFERYPRNEERDAKLAEEAGVDLLFLPTVETMYPEEMGINMIVTKGTDVLCGRSRPNHFDGVATVLSKFFNMIQPDRAYFGLKDAQQFAVVYTLISQLNFPIQLIGMPTVRDDDGLAKSSRNVYLSAEERKEASVLYDSLQLGKHLIKEGIKETATIVEKVKNNIIKNSTGTIDYVELLTYPKLEEINVVDEQIILAIAIHFKNARLIDNIILDATGEEVKTIIK